MPLRVRKLDSEALRDELTRELGELEQKHGMPSLEFYRRFRAGELGDSSEFVRWAGLCYMAVRNGVLTPPVDDA
jgi:hypothetical protein